MIGCGGAEARPIKAVVNVRVAVVGDYDWCAADAAWKAVHGELRRVTRDRALTYIDYDAAYADDRPELNTLDAFWDGSLGGYWKTRIPPGDGIRLVVLPPLQTPQGLMYGGQTLKRGAHGGWAFINGDSRLPQRDTLTALHELGHILNCPDVCHDDGRLDLMCWSSAPTLKHRPDLLHYSATCERRIRRTLGLRVAGKTLCIGEGCENRGVM